MLNGEVNRVRYVEYNLKIIESQKNVLYVFLACYNFVGIRFKWKPSF